MTTRTRWIGLAGFVIILTWASLWARFRESEAVEPRPRPELWVWDLPGCYRLIAQPWVGEGAGVAALPEYLMLAADSVDQWGRVQETYRARPMDSVSTARYRWFARADTLWIVWSSPAGAGGLALRESSDGLLGRARIGGSGDSVDVTARVQAWRVNCGTRELEVPDRIRR